MPCVSPIFVPMQPWPPAFHRLNIHAPISWRTERRKGSAVREHIYRLLPDAVMDYQRKEYNDYRCAMEADDS